MKKIDCLSVQLWYLARALEISPCFDTSIYARWALNNVTNEMMKGIIHWRNELVEKIKQKHIQIKLWSQTIIALVFDHSFFDIYFFSKNNL